MTRVAQRHGCRAWHLARQQLALAALHTIQRYKASISRARCCAVLRAELSTAARISAGAQRAFELRSKPRSWKACSSSRRPSIAPSAPAGAEDAYNGGWAGGEQLTRSAAPHRRIRAIVIQTRRTTNHAPGRSVCGQQRRRTRGLLGEEVKDVVHGLQVRHCTRHVPQWQQPPA